MWSAERPTGYPFFEDLLDDFFFGIRAPDFRASLSATATACLRLVIFFPLPDFKLPSLYSCITFSTLPLPFVAVFLAMPLLYEIDPARSQSVSNGKRTGRLSNRTIMQAARALFQGAGAFIPERRTLPVLQKAVQSCHGCDLYLHAKQAVFGEGRQTARLVLIGEQPGDQEDIQGHPFVGPAGGILTRALTDASIDRADTYVTNAVKHFKFEERGKRRLHKKPRMSEIKACEPWLEAEMKLIKPKVIVCLGATAAQTLLGSKFRLTEERGVPLEHPWADYVVATTHPSAILRARDTTDRHAQYERFVADLKGVRKLLQSFD